MAKTLRILFMCVENACRSQMAEAFARHYGGERVEAASAGSRPRGHVDPAAVAVMKERGLELSRHASKGLSTLPGEPWDVVVGMGCGEDCAVVPATRRILWQIPDPARPANGANPVGGTRQPVEVYRQVRDVIEEAVKTLLEQIVA